LKTIWKFPVGAKTTVELLMPRGAQILSGETQNDEPYIWALVDPNAPRETRTFRVFGTGWDVDESEKLQFICTYKLQGGFFIFHLFEVIK
jgi:hypothetical protein